jgi:tetratricopeptide (TPR) repeat protein
MLTQAQRRNVWILILMVLVTSAVMSELLIPGHEAYRRLGEARRGDVRDVGTQDSAFQALLPTLLGFREVMASLMWIQADDYFHRGEYRPILKMIREIVAIDPHQLDVFATGAWHMAYNFMDKRLIEDGVLFLQDGCKNNDSVYDLWFELGYMHYDKTKNYPKSVEAYRESSLKGRTTGEKVAPSYVRHQLAHAIEKMGDIDGAIAQWEENYRIGQELEKTEGKDLTPAGPNVAASRHNLYMTKRRMNERLAAVAEREKRIDEAIAEWQKNVDLVEAQLLEQPKHTQLLTDRTTALGQVARLKAGRLLPLKQTDPQFRFNVTRIAPKKLLIEGDCKVLNLAKVRAIFRDKDYDSRAAQGFDFKMTNCSIEWFDMTVQKGKFKWTLDLDKDPADMERNPEEIYPLKADQYELSLVINPRLQAAFIQDLYGWNGEGLTGPANQLKIDDQRSGVMNGRRIPLRYVERTVTISRDDVLGKGRKLIYSGS